ncbi:MAG TPA: fumarylacetoacetate hydrolase family protein [Micromonosporaceae bacterium]|nr:fumarylacetoacetate hydrolase family protein [Micromonosporaceae bacterium]
MKLANLDGRSTLLRDGLAVDVHRHSGGQLPADPAAAFERWAELRSWADGLPAAGRPFDPAQLGPPSPRPRQVFALALNYPPHVAEAGYTPPEWPLVFTKFPTCVAGPVQEVTLPGDRVDWEAELVVVIGRRAERVSEEDAWNHVAGLTVGQDLSEREVQLRGQPAQFSLAKSYPGFGPTGPWLLTPDEFDDPDDLELTCELNGELVQHARTKEMIFSVPRTLALLSAVCPLLPGDLVFTGTPGGVGNRRTPPRYLTPADTLLTRVEGIGEIRQTFRSPP